MPKDTTSKQCPNPAPSGVQNCTAGSDIGKARLSNYCATSLMQTFRWLHFSLTYFVFSEFLSG